MNDLLKLAVDARGGMRRWERDLPVPRRGIILRGGPAVHHPSACSRFDGVMVPTRRRVHVRNPDGSPALASTSIDTTVTAVKFT